MYASSVVCVERIDTLDQYCMLLLKTIDNGNIMYSLQFSSIYLKKRHSNFGSVYLSLPPCLHLPRVQ